MSEQSPSVADRVTEILAHLPALDANRKQMLFLWLQAHRSGLYFTDANLEDCLTEWFNTLSGDGVNWEHRLILSEIAWWRDLDEPSLAEFMRSERARNRVASANVPSVVKS